MIIFLNSIALFIKSVFKYGLIWIALSSALCIWISPETLIPILLVEAVLFCYAILPLPNLKDAILHKLFSKNLLLSFFIILIIAPSIILDGVSHVYYDAISIVHFSLFMSISLFLGVILYCTSFKVIASSKKKFIIFRISIFVGLVISYVFLRCYPKFLCGMSADIPPFVKEIWLSRIAEMKSPFEHGEHFFFISHAVFIVVAIISKAKTMITNRRAANSLYAKDLMWWIFIAIALSYLIFASCASRMLLYSTLFGFPLIVEFGMNSEYTKCFHRFWRIIITFFMATLFMFVTAYFNQEVIEESSNNYTTKELFFALDNINKTPVVIMAHSNDGPAILYYTKHSVVGAPYHRQISGIISSYLVMEAEYSETKIKNVLKSTNADYIFIRKSQYKNVKKQQNSLAKMIIDGRQPKWIKIIDFSKKFKDVLIAEIDKNFIYQ